MRTGVELKQLLTQIKANNYQTQIPAIDGIVADMLKYIGDIDPELRDELIYSIFWKWTVKGVLSAEQMKSMLSVCLDNDHLFFGLGEKNTDSVFTRTFSVLLVPLAMYMNQQNAFLSDAEALNIKETVLRYIRREKDFRGYVEGRGWAHAMAHAADALDDIAKLDCIGRDDLLEILDVVKEKMSNRDWVYSCEEDERMTTAFMAVYRRKLLTDKDIADWLDSFRIIKNRDVYDYFQQINQKNFLRSLYFRFLPQEGADELQKEMFKFFLETSIPKILKTKEKNT